MTDPRSHANPGDVADVLVIGAGVGGLVAAALLARRGAKVVVLEQHLLAGGYCTSWERRIRVGDERQVYVFDAGVHDVSGLAPGGGLRAVLDELGVADRIVWRRVEHAHLLPGLELRLPPTPGGALETLAARFPADAEGLARFFAEIESAYRALAPGASEGRGASLEERREFVRRNRQGLRWLKVPFGSMVRTFVRDPALRTVLARLGRYRTDEVESLSVGEMAPLYGYLIDGGFYPVGGSQALPDALAAALRRDGGELRLEAPVSRILVEQGRAVGARLASGEELRARVVISNADVRRTICELLPEADVPTEYRRRLDAATPSNSAFLVFLGVRGVPDLAELVFIRADDGTPLSLWMPSRADPQLAPPGHSAVTLTTLVPHSEAGHWERGAPGYSARKRAFGDRLIAAAERAWPGLQEQIVFREDASPATFERYTRASSGAIYGLATTALRPPARTPVPGLFLAGGGTFPGPGIEAVAISGALAAELVEAELATGPQRRTGAR